MGSHRRKWGWWLVAAFAVVLAASLLFRRNADRLSAPASASGDSSAVSVPVIRDTVFVTVDGGTVPIVRERPVEPSRKRSEEVFGEVLASGETPGEEFSEAPAPPAEWVVSVPVEDIAGLIRGKSGRDINLATQAPDRISVSYAGKVDIPLLGEQNMDVSAAFRIVEAHDDRLVLQLDNGSAMNVAADLVAPYIVERLPAGLVESFSGGRAVVNLSSVPSLKKRLSGLSLTGVSVDESSIRLSAVEK